MTKAKQLGLTAILLSACAPGVGQIVDDEAQNSFSARNPVVEMNISADGKQLTSFIVRYNPEDARKGGKCEKILGKYNLPDGNYFSVTKESCDTDDDGKRDYHSLTKTGRGETIPTIEIYVLPAQDGTGKNTSQYCLVRKFKETPNGIMYRDSVAKCDSVLSQVIPEKK